mgnify:FL=1
MLYYDERGERYVVFLWERERMGLMDDRLAHLLSAHVPSRKTASDFTMDVSAQLVIAFEEKLRRVHGRHWDHATIRRTRFEHRQRRSLRSLRL